MRKKKRWFGSLTVWVLVTSLFATSGAGLAVAETVDTTESQQQPTAASLQSSSEEILNTPITESSTLPEESTEETTEPEVDTTQPSVTQEEIAEPTQSSEVEETTDSTTDSTEDPDETEEELAAIQRLNGFMRNGLTVDTGAFVVDDAVIGDEDVEYKKLSDDDATKTNVLRLISSNKTYHISMKNGATTTDRIEIEGTGITVVLQDVEIDLSGWTGWDDNPYPYVNHAPIAVLGSATATVELQGSNVLKAGVYSAALQNNNSVGTPESPSLVIKGNGVLEAIGGLSGAGIGGGYGGSGIITIDSGTVIAEGGSSGAGIGGGQASSGTVMIKSGTVTAKGGFGGAGIGGGNEGIGGSHSSIVTIKSGTVTAEGSDGGAGIGGGCGGSGIITIDSGTVTATSTGSNPGSAVGDGNYSFQPGSVEITGGSVKAKKGNGAIGSADSINPRPVNANGDDLEQYIADDSGFDPGTGVYVDGIPFNITHKHEGDDDLYLYLTKENHRIEIGGEMHHIRWDAAQEKFIQYNLSEFGDFVVDRADSASFNGAVLTLNGSGNYYVSMKPNISQTTHRIFVTGNVDTVTIDGLNIVPQWDKAGSPIEVDGNISATVDLVGENRLISTSNHYAGLQHNAKSDSCLTITSTVDTSGGYKGKLTASGSTTAAGIGGGNGSTGIIKIEGGTILSSSIVGAGIGGGKGSEGIVTIEGGTIATYSNTGAGMGGGDSGAGNVTISGGTVTATGDSGGSGIGNGIYSSGGSVTITGGSVKAIKDGTRGISAISPAPTDGTTPVVEHVVAATGFDPVTGVKVNDNDFKIPSLHPLENGGVDDKFYLYLPKDKNIVDIGGNLTNFYGDFKVSPAEGVTYTNETLSLGKDDGEYHVQMREPGYTTTTDRIEVTASNAQVTIDSLGINLKDKTGNPNSPTAHAAFSIAYNASVTVKLVGANAFKSGYRCAGLQNQNKVVDSLIIQDESNGSLDATGGYGGAGIGGGYEGSSAVKIKSGTVIANGDWGAAGIGGGDGGSGTVTIESGEVTANGGYRGAGIGGGFFRSGIVTIKSGTVTTTGVGGGSGIGNGIYSSGGSVTITGGSVKAIKDGTRGISAINPAPTDGTTPVVEHVVAATGFDPVTGVKVNDNDFKIPSLHPLDNGFDDKFYLYLPKGKNIVDIGDNLTNFYGDFQVSPAEGVTYTDKTLSLGKDDGEYHVQMRTPGHTTKTDRIEVTASNVQVTIEDLGIDLSGEQGTPSPTTDYAAFSIASNASATVKLVGANVFKSGEYRAGLQNQNTAANSLIIQDESNGSLDSTGGDFGAGIGGGIGGSGVVTIESGEVIAKGGTSGAGIGGGSGRSGTVTIESGEVTAKGGIGGSGIGGGENGSGTVTITSGTVTATAGSKSSGIGGGYSGTGDVTITGGTVTATSTGSRPGSAVGDGHNSSHPGSVTITGGSVKAKKGDEAAGSVNSIFPEPKNAAGEPLKLYKANASTFTPSSGDQAIVGTTDFKVPAKHDSDDNLYLYLTHQKKDIQPNDRHVVKIGSASEKYIQWKDTAPQGFVDASTYSISIPSSSVELNESTQKNENVTVNNEFYQVPGYDRTVSVNLKAGTLETGDILTIPNKVDSSISIKSQVTFPGITLASIADQEEEQISFTPPEATTGGTIRAGDYEKQIVFVGALN